MQITLTARHCEISDDVKERAELLMRRLAKYARRPHEASVIFDEDHQRKVVEIQMRAAKGNPKIASAEADDFRSALDRAVGRLKQQLVREPVKHARRA